MDAEVVESANPQAAPPVDTSLQTLKDALGAYKKVRALTNTRPAHTRPRLDPHRLAGGGPGHLGELPQGAAVQAGRRRVAALPRGPGEGGDRGGRAARGLTPNSAA